MAVQMHATNPTSTNELSSEVELEITVGKYPLGKYVADILRSIERKSAVKLRIMAQGRFTRKALDLKDLLGKSLPYGCEVESYNTTLTLKPEGVDMKLRIRRQNHGYALD